MGPTSERVLVTGASGHVGANLVRALLREGRRVRALVHVRSRALDGLEVECVVGDITDATTIGSAFEDVAVVYHCAAVISITGRAAGMVQEVNVEGTRNVVRACLSHHVTRLVHFSSIHAVADPGPDVTIDEDSPLALTDSAAPYDRSKAQAEVVVRDAIQRGLDAVVVAPTAVVGPYDYRPSHFGRVLLSLARGHMPALVQGGYDWVDVRDMVQGAMVAAVRAPRGSKYMLSGRWASLVEVADSVGAVRCCRRPLVCAPQPLTMIGASLNETWCRLRGTDPLFTRVALQALLHHRRVSHERATRDLGYLPRPLSDTILATVRWFEEEGLLRPFEAAK
jgi:dihydroflavonol-4-reductase